MATRGRPVIHLEFECRKCKLVKPRSEFPSAGTCKSCYTPRKPIVTEKPCKQCKLVKPRSEFPINGTLNTCKVCYAPKQAEHNRFQKYRVPTSVLTKLWEEQEGRCGIPSCRAVLKSLQSAHVDHRHDTGAVRGLLCQRCNVLEGFLSKAGETCVQDIFEWSRRPGINACESSCEGDHP